MNGLSSPALHVGVDLASPLAEAGKPSWRSSRLIGRAAASLVCGRTFCRWWKWDTFVPQYVVDIFTGAARGVRARRGEPLATSRRTRLCSSSSRTGVCVYVCVLCECVCVCVLIWGLQKLPKHREEFIFFLFLSFLFFCIISSRFVLKVTACAHERPRHFLKTFFYFLLTYARLRLAFSAHLCSI